MQIGAVTKAAFCVICSELNVLKMSRKLKRQFKKLDRMMDEWGFDMDDPIIGRNKITAEVEFEGIDFVITLEKDGKSWKKDLDLLKLEVDARELDLEILWEFDDVRKADKSLLKDMKNGAYHRAIGMLEDQKYSRFNDYIEDLNGFANSDITLNGSTFF